MADRLLTSRARIGFRPCGHEMSFRCGLTKSKFDYIIAKDVRFSCYTEYRTSKCKKQGEKMKATNGLARVFGTMGILLAALAVTVSLLAREASPWMLVAPRGASTCAEAMLSRLSAGDYAGASEYLYGHPSLDAGKIHSSELTQQIWDAFTGSLQYELMGGCYATTKGIAQKVLISGLEISSVTGSLQQRAQSLLEARVDRADSMDEIYDEDFNYRADLLSAVLHDAADEAVAKDGRMQQRELTLNMVYENDRWWVVLDQPLLNAISGGMVG